MKQGKKVVIVCVFVLAGLLSLIGMTTNVGGAVQENHTVGRQIVLRLIDHFAEPECAEGVDDPQQKTTSFDHPVPECWLVTEAQAALENPGGDEE
jgi:hypothetical protein